MRVLMMPRLDNMAEGGIKRVIEGYTRHAKNFEYVNCDINDLNSYDLLAVHIDAGGEIDVKKPIVYHIHGMYWTGDYPNSPNWHYKINRRISLNIIAADVVTVPSLWVSTIIQRWFHIDPMIVPHGIDFAEWATDEHRDWDDDSYVLWNKNRTADVCSIEPLIELARRNKNIKFVSTFCMKDCPPNIETIGLLPHNEMREYVRNAGAYLSTTKETFGIGTVEAMAAGVPVIGYNWGGNVQIVRNMIDGYLASPNDIDQLDAGLKYIMNNRGSLSRNAAERAKYMDWENVIWKVELAYKTAIERYEQNK